MRLPDTVRTVILAVLPWYHTGEVEARHAETRKVLREARVERARIREPYREIARRLDEKA